MRRERRREAAPWGRLASAALSAIARARLVGVPVTCALGALSLLRMTLWLSR